MHIRQTGRRWLVPAVTAAILTGMLSPAASANGQGDLSARIRLIEPLEREGDYAAALEILRSALLRHPDDYNVRCWMAQILMDSSEVVTRSGSRREVRLLYEEAVAHARTAASVRPGDAEGWYQVGRTVGAVSQLIGGSEAVRLARESKTAFETAISLDPSHAAALHGLARWHRSVANLSNAERIAASLFFGGLPPASYDEAVLLFRRSIAAEPDVIVHHLELAKTYMELGQIDSARVESEIVLELPETSHWDAARKGEARRLLDSIIVKRRP